MASFKCIGLVVKNDEQSHGVRLSMYGNARRLENGMLRDELHVAGVEIIEIGITNNLPDDVSKVFILHGKGNKFCLRNSRLEIYVDKIFSGIFKAEVRRDYHLQNSRTMTNGASLVRVLDVNTSMESLNAPFLGLQLLEGNDLRDALREKKKINSKASKTNEKQTKGIKQKKKIEEQPTAGSSKGSSQLVLQSSSKRFVSDQRLKNQASATKRTSQSQVSLSALKPLDYESDLEVTESESNSVYSSMSHLPSTSTSMSQPISGDMNLFTQFSSTEALLKAFSEFKILHPEETTTQKDTESVEATDVLDNSAQRYNEAKAPRR